MSTVFYVILAILVLGVCVTLHELGHFLAARACGIHVEEFSVGMGPAILQKQGKETKYSLRALPFGGYCAFIGEDMSDDNDDPRNINSRPAWQRLVMTAAGPITNFLLSLLLAVVLMAVVGQIVVSNRIATVTEDSPAAVAGLQVGDTVVGVYGLETKDVESMQIIMDSHGTEPVELMISRDGERKTVTVERRYDEESGRYLMGITFATERTRIGLFPAIRSSVTYCIDLFREMLKALGTMFTDKEVMDSMAGPVGTVQLMTQYTKESFAESFTEGITMLLNLAVIISMNLGLMNFLPLPALDGGRVVLLLLECVTGKHMNRKVEAAVHMVGLFLLLGLIVVLTGRDVFRLFK